MLWVTRPRPHIDRTACAWLIRRFVDPEAEFGFAEDAEGAAVLGGTPFLRFTDRVYDGLYAWVQRLTR